MKTVMESYGWGWLIAKEGRKSLGRRLSRPANLTQSAVHRAKAAANSANSLFLISLIYGKMGGINYYRNTFASPIWFWEKNKLQKLTRWRVT